MFHAGTDSSIDFDFHCFRNQPEARFIDQIKFSTNNYFVIPDFVNF